MTRVVEAVLLSTTRVRSSSAVRITPPPRSGPAVTLPPGATTTLPPSVSEPASGGKPTRCG
jgi:hypothetical protein